MSNSHDDSTGAKREWQFYLDDMCKFARNVLIYTEELDQATFIND